jgi:hypothetical protein
LFERKLLGKVLRRRNNEEQEGLNVHWQAWLGVSLMIDETSFLELVNLDRSDQLAAISP